MTHAKCKYILKRNITFNMKWGRIKSLVSMVSEIGKIKLNEILSICTSALKEHDKNNDNDQTVQ